MGKTKRGVSDGGRYLDSDPTTKGIPSRKKRVKKRKSQGAARRINRKK